MSLLFSEPNFNNSEFSTHQTLPLQEETPEILSKSEPLPTSEPSKALMNYITSILKKEDELTLKEKLEFSYGLCISIGSFNKDLVKEFTEEEHHLTMMNWIWRYRKKLKEFLLESGLKRNLNNSQNFESSPQKYNILLIEINFIIELLINILNFFVYLPITSSDILNLKLYEKLLKIKGYINSYVSQEVLNLTDFILKKWKTQVDFDNEEKIIARYKLNKLGIKRNRSGTDDQDTEADSIDNDTNGINNNIKINNLNIHNNQNINLNKKIKNKNIKVSFDLQQNSVAYFDKDDMPFQITLDQNKNLTDIKSVSASSVK